MSYGAALIAAGCDVLECEYTGSYQGEWYALVRVDGEIGIVTGCYGSCSVCDAFEAEFGYDEEDKPDYQERLADFGRSYLPPLPIDHEIDQLTKHISDYDYGDYQEALNYIKGWKVKYNL